MTKNNISNKVHSILLKKLVDNYTTYYENWFACFLSGDFAGMRYIREQQLEQIVNTATSYKVSSKAYFERLDNRLWKEMTLKYADEYAEAVL